VQDTVECAMQQDMCTQQSLSNGIEGVVDEQDLGEIFEIYN